MRFKKKRPAVAVLPVRRSARRDALQCNLMQHSNLQIRKESTSGGAFTAIAEYVIRHDGVVFGAAFDTQYVVRHQYAERKRAIESLSVCETSDGCGASS